MSRSWIAPFGVLVVVGCGGGPEREESLGEAASEAVVCAEGEELRGIDVSYYQGQPNWAAVGATGLSFAITRVNHGDFMDPEFDNNWEQIRANGMIRGAYQYFDPGGDPVEQANVFIDRVGRLGPGDLPGVIDVESTDGLSPSQVADNVATWIDLVEVGTGRRPMIYTGSYFWNDNVQTDMFNDHHLWIAHYTNACPNLPTVWQRWTFWQFTDSGSVDGIAGNVDTNNFNGSWEDLNDVAANGYRANIVSVDYPSKLNPGQVGRVEIVVENLGARTWGSDVMIGTTMPRDRVSVFQGPDWESSSRALALDADVAENETTTISFEIIAPAEVGAYTEHFNLVREAVAWFSDPAPAGGPPDDVIALDITVTDDEILDDPDDPVGGAGDGEVKAVFVVEGEAGCSLAQPRGEGGHPWWLLLAVVPWIRRRGLRDK